MSSLDIQPPSAPVGAAPRKKGFFSKLFSKGQEVPQPPSTEEELKSFDRTLEDETFDLEDIRKKLGIEDESAEKDTPSADEDSTPPDNRSEEPPVNQQQTFEVPPTSFEEELPAIPENAKSDFTLEDWAKSPEEEAMPEESQEEIVLETPDAPDARNDDAQPLDWTADHAIETSRVAETEAPASKWAEHPEPEGGSADSPWVAHPEQHAATEEAKESAPPIASEEMTADAGTREDATKTAEAAKTEEKPQPTQPEPEVEEPEPVAPEEVASIAKPHLGTFQEKHQQLHEELGEMLAEKDELPNKDHPHDVVAPEGQEFILKNGQPLTTIKELLAALDVIDTETFFHHVNEHRNDFASWIRHVFKDEALADELAQATSRKAVVKALKAHGRAADRKFRNSDKYLKQAIKARAERIDRIKGFDDRIVELKAELAKKEAELNDQKRLIDERVHKQIAAELQKRLKAARAELKQETNEAKKRKTAYERQAKTFEKRMAAREERFKAKQESLKKIEKTIKDEKNRLASETREEQRRFEQEKAEAGTIIQQADEVRAQLAAIEKGRTELEEEQKKLAEQHEKIKKDLRSVNAKLASQVRQESSIKKEKETLNRREQDLTRQEAQLKRDLQEHKLLKNELERDRKAFAAKEKATIAKLETQEKKATGRIRKAKEAEEKVEEKLKERRRIASFVGEAERHLEEQEQRLEAEGMHGYLDKKLKAIKSGTSAVLDVPPAGAIRNLKIYSMIDKAQSSLDSGDLKEARDLYNRIRDAFNKEELSPSEKQVLYTTIRELYDDIHLAALK